MFFHTDGLTFHPEHALRSDCRRQCLLQRGRDGELPPAYPHMKLLNYLPGQSDARAVRGACSTTVAGSIRCRGRQQHWLRSRQHRHRAKRRCQSPPKRSCRSPFRRRGQPITMPCCAAASHTASVARCLHRSVSIRASKTCRCCAGKVHLPPPAPQSAPRDSWRKDLERQAVERQMQDDAEARRLDKFDIGAHAGAHLSCMTTCSGRMPSVTLSPCESDSG